MNTIFIRELRIETRIGVYEWEQHMAQPLLVDIELEVPSAKAFASDNFADALDYSAVVKRVQSRRTRQRRALVEVDVFDGTSYLRCTFFNQPWRAKQLREGADAVFFGKLEAYRANFKKMMRFRKTAKRELAKRVS